MEAFSQQIQVRWADMDPNFHLRHSVYYDWGAMCRMDYLTEKGLTPAIFKKLKFGPIIFREEAVFRKEIVYGDNISINLTLMKGRKDYSRWTISHEILKNNTTLCAVITVDGAWLNLLERKLFIPPAEAVAVFEQMQKNDHFEWHD